MTGFRRPRHAAVARALAALDGALLDRAGAFFGGDTAIVLQLGEYRESADIDFLCDSAEGWRTLREAVWGKGLGGLLKPGATVQSLRDLRADQYGLRTFLAIEGIPIRFEIVREARIALSGAPDPALGVPVLDRTDLYAEKLLANADRWADPGVASRDIIDLSMMIAHWGPVPEAAWAKARAAYGDTVGQAFARAVALIRDPVHLARCMQAMAMDGALAAGLLAPHGGPNPPAGTDPA